MLYFRDNGVKYCCKE